MVPQHPRSLCIAWALFRGLNEDDTKFATFLNVDIVVPRVFVQKNSWECGHHGVQKYKSRPKIYMLQVEYTKLSTLKHRK
jgi:hypothetical protein